MRKSTFIQISLLFILSLLPLSARAIGEWSVYNAVPDITRIQYFDERIYAISGTSLISFSTDTLDFDYQQETKSTGLTGMQVKFITTSDAAQCLAIVYEDGNIDVIYKNGEIACIPDLSGKTMTGDKTVNSIIEDQGLLYLSCGFGFIAVDLENQQIPISCNTSFPILYAFRYGDNIYRYSEKHHLEYCSTSQNTSDNANWETIYNGNLLDASIVYGQNDAYCWLISSNGNLLQLNAPDDIVTLRQGSYQSIHALHHTAMLKCNDHVELANPDEQTFTVNTESPVPYCIDFTADETDQLMYMLYTDNGIYRMEIKNYEPGSQLQFAMDFDHVMKASGLITAFLGDMQLTDNGILGIARRSYTAGQSKAFALAGVVSRYSFDDDEWQSLNSQKAITSRLSYRTSFQGLTGLAIDPTQENRYAISSSLHGLYILDHDTLQYRYDDLNSNGIVEAFGANFLSARVSAVAYDDDGNLYFANAMQDTILRCLTPEGNCIKYPNGGFTQQNDCRRILIAKHDNYGFKWVLNDYGYQKSKVGIYYDGGSPAGVSSSKYQTAWFNTLVDQDNNEYTPYYIYDLCEDLNGKVWVLTNLGPFVIEDPKTTFEYAQKNPGMGKVRRVKIPRNDGTNLADYLMESTMCTCMAIDNFNRKWIGTNGAGLYLMSDDCITTIEHFTTDDSPLLSDGILALCYDPTTGKLFISCEGGVLTYQTDAIEGADDFSGIYCYPNPVRPEYSGDLRIMGLMNDSKVSITTTNGNLIYRSVSQGATATWDLRTATGSRIDPGIYIIHGVSADGKEGSICKFLVL